MIIGSGIRQNGCFLNSPSNRTTFQLLEPPTSILDNKKEVKVMDIREFQDN
jgi:hypothetical protein